MSQKPNFKVISAAEMYTFQQMFPRTEKQLKKIIHNELLVEHLVKLFGSFHKDFVEKVQQQMVENEKFGQMIQKNKGNQTKQSENTGNQTSQNIGNQDTQNPGPFDSNDRNVQDLQNVGQNWKGLMNFNDQNKHATKDLAPKYRPILELEGEMRRNREDKINRSKRNKKGLKIPGSNKTSLNSSLDPLQKLKDTNVVQTHKNVPLNAQNSQDSQQSIEDIHASQIHQSVPKDRPRHKFDEQMRKDKEDLMNKRKRNKKGQRRKE